MQLVFHLPWMDFGWTSCKVHPIKPEVHSQKCEESRFASINLDEGLWLVEASGPEALITGNDLCTELDEDGVARPRLTLYLYKMWRYLSWEPRTV
mmetsp:Transcript_37586/g.45349  ORF Transcript_37586/g.45349 Transcript_37586/m.45349 type:complete len:95 (-) Transcript_37586:74-358(-)